MLGAIKELSNRGKRLALFTGKERQRTGELLERLGLSPAFELVITSDDVERGKPDAEGLLRILSFTGVAASRALMVGDGLFDLECAMAADVDSALVKWGAIDLATHRLPMLPRWILDAPAQLYRSPVPLAIGAGR
jgi:phosphoglycolate phosphatase-like HAD superfamily hydrolase